MERVWSSEDAPTPICLTHSFGARFIDAAGVGTSITSRTDVAGGPRGR
jgi:hypothetical protein